MALSERKQQQHVVAVPLPAQGHINPLMRFCEVLASQGFLVTFVNIDAVHDRIEELVNQQQQEEDNIKAHEQGNGRSPAAAAAAEETSQLAAGINIRRARIPIDGLDLASDFRVSFQVCYEALLNSMAPQLELLILQLNRQGPPVTCIVCDSTLALPTQAVADKLDIPKIVLISHSASLLLLYYHVIQGEHISITKVLEALTTRRADRREVICDGLMGLPTIYTNDLPSFKHVVDDNLYAWDVWTKACCECFRHARAMVINSFEDLEAPAFTALSKHLSLPIYGVGPLVQPLRKETSTSLWKEDEACLLWLDQQPPLSVLYISFGSITLLSQPQFEEIVAGLLSSQQWFLWVFRPDLVENAEYSSTFASDVVSRSQGRGYVVDWAIQPRVLSHPSVGGFLTHCGWNSTMEAIAHGVPMLCWPYFADQFLDAKYVVEEWKVGLQFEASCKEGACLVERGEVERVIKALMQSEEGAALRKNAMHFKERGSLSLVPGGTSHRDVQALIRSFV